MKAVLKFRADLGRDLVTPQGGIMIDYAKMYRNMADKCQPGSKAERKFRLLSLAYAKLGLGAWRGNNPAGSKKEPKK